MRGDSMFFKKKPKYLTITTPDESCAIINLREILFVKKHNFKNNIFGIEFTFKKGNAFCQIISGRKKKQKIKKGKKNLIQEKWLDVTYTHNK